MLKFCVLVLFSFFIHVRGTSPLRSPITISEGDDLHLNVPNIVNGSCKLYGPDGLEFTDADIIPSHETSCRYIVKNVTRSQRGNWIILHGNQVATFQVKVLGSDKTSKGFFEWTVGSAVNITVDPEDAVYCKLKDNRDNTVFDGFGPCRIVIERVSMAHRGEWTMLVGIPGKVALQEHRFAVNVIAPVDSKPVVEASIIANVTSLVLMCSVPTLYEVQACSFRDPDGDILIASPEHGQDGYSGPSTQFFSESDTHSHNCTVRLMQRYKMKEGIWRCAVQTKHGISYGFLTVKHQRLPEQYSVQSSQVAVSVPGPRLRSESNYYPVLKGDPVTISCYIETPIRYCYFRAGDGTIFNVGPSIPSSSSGFEYVGNGFDAGECGIRFYSFSEQLNLKHDRWSCSVGLVDTLEEQTYIFSVQDACSVSHWSDGGITITLNLYDELEYCRFVRSDDGLSFTSNDVPDRYDFSTPDMSTGDCQLNIQNPTYEDMGSWTVFAKVVGDVEEVSYTTSNNLERQVPRESQVGTIFLWTTLGVACLFMVLAAMSLLFRKNREWRRLRETQAT